MDNDNAGTYMWALHLLLFTLFELLVFPKHGMHYIESVSIQRRSMADIPLNCVIFDDAGQEANAV